MTSRKMAVAPAAAPDEEIIEITDDMILELEPRPPRGKLLFLPPPLPRAAVLPPTRTRRRPRGSYPVIRDKN